MVRHRLRYECPECNELVHLEDLCEECESCLDCCECVNVGGAELFDADELGLDPEDDEERKYPSA